MTPPKQTGEPKWPPRTSLYWWPNGVYEYDLERYCPELIEVPVISLEECEHLLREARAETWKRAARDIADCELVEECIEHMQFMAWIERKGSTSERQG